MLLPGSASFACCALRAAQYSDCHTLAETGVNIIIFLYGTGRWGASVRGVKGRIISYGSLQDCLCLASSIFVSALVLCGIGANRISYLMIWIFLLDCFVG